MGTKVSYPARGPLPEPDEFVSWSEEKREDKPPASTNYVSPAAGKSGTPPERTVRKAIRD